MTKQTPAPAGALDAVVADVAEFHAVFARNPAPQEPTLQTAELAMRRSDWVREEMDELLTAKTVAEQADAYIDAMYFCVGGLLELGIDPSPLWSIVHRANMAKRQPDGSVLRDVNNSNKVIKPAGWIDPKNQLEAEVGRQLEAARIRNAERAAAEAAEREAAEREAAEKAQAAQPTQEGAEEPAPPAEELAAAPAGEPPTQADEPAPEVEEA